MNMNALAHNFSVLILTLNKEANSLRQAATVLEQRAATLDRSRERTILIMRRVAALSEAKGKAEAAHRLENLLRAWFIGLQEAGVSFTKPKPPDAPDVLNSPDVINLGTNLTDGKSL